MNYLKLFEHFDYDPFDYSIRKSTEHKSKFKSEILPELKDILIDIKDDEFDYTASFSEADGPIDYDTIHIRLFKSNKSFFHLSELKEKILHLDSFLRSEHYFLSKDSSYYATYNNPYKRRKLNNPTLGIREFSFKDVKFELDHIHLSYLISSSIDKDTGEEFYI